MKNRRHFLGLAAAALVAPVISVKAQSKKYPDKPITVIVPFSPGGNIDVTTRIVADAMSKALGVTFVINNRAGAGGIIGLQATAREKPDGYTLLTCGNGTYAVSPKLTPGKTVESSDFAPVGMLTVTPLILEVPNNSQFKDFEEFAKFAKANPEKLTIGHAGVGTTNHLAILQLQEALGTKFTIVPYKGSAPGLTDLVGGQIDAFIDQLPSSLQLISTQKIRPLAVTAKDSVPDLPKVPTMTQLGLKGVDAITATCMLAPANTPADVIATLNKALNDALALPEVTKKMATLGATTQKMTPDELAAFLKKEDENATALIKKGLLKAA